MTPAEEFITALRDALDFEKALDALDTPAAPYEDGIEDEGWYPDWAGPEEES